MKRETELALHVMYYESNKIRTLCAGWPRHQLIALMRRMSQVASIVSPVEEDMSGSITGYPQINHQDFSLQVSESVES